MALVGQALSSLRPTLAPLACINCKTRKKGCDKKLPSCSYCVQRSIVCYYVTPVLKDNEGHSSIREARPIAAPESPTFESSLASKDTLHLQVYQAISMYGKYTDEVSVKYFQSIHHWFPIISRRRFHDSLMSLSRTNADFSVLLLSMCLITSHPAQDLEMKSSDQEKLYLTSKILFAHAQALTSTSTHLIQAACLIALYEHCHGLNDAAYISIGTCARMAYAANLHQKTRCHLTKDDQSWLRDQEEKNLWWGIVLCERYIAAETTQNPKVFVTVFPGIDEDLPLEVDILECDPTSNTNPGTPQPLSSFSSDYVGRFGRQAQAAYLYTEVLKTITQSASADTVMDATELLRLDNQIREFLTTIMCPKTKTWGLYCGSLAFTMSAWLDLHEYIIRQFSKIPNFQSLVETSKAALGAIARIIFSVALSFNENVAMLDLESLPPRCSHFVRAAQYLLVSSSDNIDKEERLKGFEDLRKMLRNLGWRWRIALKQAEVLETNIKILN